VELRAIKPNGLQHFAPEHHFRSSIELDAAASKSSVIYNAEADASVCVDLESLWAQYSHQ
jgi:hypothetical protein